MRSSPPGLPGPYTYKGYPTGMAHTFGDNVLNVLNILQKQNNYNGTSASGIKNLSKNDNIYSPSMIPTLHSNLPKRITSPQRINQLNLCCPQSVLHAEVPQYAHITALVKLEKWTTVLNSNTSTHRGSAESSTMKHKLLLSEYNYVYCLVAMGNQGNIVTIIIWASITRLFICVFCGLEAICECLHC